jgi:hypothetical protein
VLIQQDATRDYELSFKLNGNATEASLYYTGTKPSIKLGLAVMFSYSKLSVYLQDICLQNKGAQQYHQCCHHCKVNGDKDRLLRRLISGSKTCDKFHDITCF